MILLMYIHYWIIIFKTWWKEWKFYIELTPYHDTLNQNKFYYIFDIDIKKASSVRIHRFSKLINFY